MQTGEGREGERDERNRWTEGEKDERQREEGSQSIHLDSFSPSFASWRKNTYKIIQNSSE